MRETTTSQSTFIYKFNTSKYWFTFTTDTNDFITDLGKYLGATSMEIKSINIQNHNIITVYKDYNNRFKFRDSDNSYISKKEILS